MKNSKFFTTGELAKLTGVSKQLLIFYDKQGIFSSTSTDDNGYRRYSLSSYFRLKMLLHLRKLDLSLNEIDQYLRSCHTSVLRNIYERKLKEYRRTISLLERKCDILCSRLEKMTFQSTGIMNQVLLQELTDSKHYIGWINETNIPVKDRISHIARILFPYLKDFSCLHDSIQGYILPSDTLHTKGAPSSYTFLTGFHPSMISHGIHVTRCPGLYMMLRTRGYHGIIAQRSKRMLLDFLDRNRLIPDDHIFILPDDCTGVSNTAKWKITIMIRVFPK